MTVPIRVMSSDVSLCVLSLPELASGVGLDETVMTLIKPETFVLLNKSDLSGPQELSAIRDQFGACSGVWPVSVVTGRGMNEFVEEFAREMNVR